MRRTRGVLVLLNVLTVVLMFVSTTSSASARTLVVFGEDYKKTKAGPVTSTQKFNVSQPGNSYTLRVFNGGEHGLSTPVSSAIVSLNGRQILGTSDFDANTRRLERTVQLEAKNTLVVELRGSIGSFFTIVIDDTNSANDKGKHDDKEHNDNRDGDKHDKEHVDNRDGDKHDKGPEVNPDTVPPTIQGTINPPPNASGWNNSDVTVSFTCSDAQGIASCSGPTVLATNGANQIVTGTAVDTAGNTATTSVRVNLDKGTPSITATVSPTPNANGWNDADVTVTFVCTDGLSGVASCPGPSHVTTEGANRLVTGTVVDNAGNSSIASIRVNLDKSSPSITATATPAANANGWNNGNVTISFVCNDGLSGTVSCPGPTTLSTNGADQAVTGSTTDKAGNTATTTATVSIDKSAPSITAVATPAANANGWNNADVTVSFTCSDALSGTDTCPGPTTVSTSGANQSVSGTTTDKAGNTATATATVNLDKSSPSITAATTPAANVNGWNNTNVTVTFTCNDGESGTNTCSGPTTLSSDGADQTVTGTTSDNAGNTANATATVNLDKTLPSITATLTPAANVNGWNNSNVTVTFTCSDALSGTDSCSSPATLTTNGTNQAVTGTTADKAGNTASTTTSINLDKTLPTISATSAPSPNGNGWNNTDVTVTFTCSDALSGLAACPSPVTLTTPGASLAVNGSATDRAGNIANTSAVINLDKQGPTLSLSSTPSTVSSAAFTLGGTVMDDVSGVTRVLCNSVEATISGTDFSCALTLVEGPNTIQVMAFDIAGNTASTSVTITLATFVPPGPGPTAISWINPVGVSSSGNNLTKTNSASLWNSGADSLQVLADGYGFVEFTATETSTSRIAGLGSVDSNQDYADVDFGILLRNDTTMAIYESGVHRGEFGNYAASDRLRVEVRYGAVRYFKNGTLLYTSLAPVKYPLRVDTSLWSPGATLTDVRVGNFVWTDGSGVLISGESVIKTAGAGWNAGAISTNTIESGNGFLEFTASETNTSRIAGMANIVSGVAVSDIQFGIMLNGDGTVEVMEGGSSRGLFGSYASGDRFRVELKAGVVRYFRNNALIYTSLQAPVYPLRADSALDTPGATLTDVALKSLNWTTTPSAYADGALLIKSSANGWTTSPSTGFNIVTGDGYAEFTAVETNKRRGLGLKSGGSASSYDQIDYLLVLNETGTVEVFELGTSRGVYGTYQNGDRFRVEIQAGIIRYRKNGTLLFSSAVSTAYPVHAEAVLYSQGATLVNVDLGELVWMNAMNARSTEHLLVKNSSTLAWDAGAASTRSTSSGYMEFTASETSTFRVAGLSNGDTNQDYTDVDFAILLRSDGSVAVYEAGVFRGNVSTYVTGDRFRVDVQAGTVRYFKNGSLLYTSGIHPVAPLKIDTSLNGPNSTLFNVIFR
jgi:hypothetical protein